MKKPEQSKKNIVIIVSIILVIIIAIVAISVNYSNKKQRQRERINKKSNPCYRTAQGTDCNNNPLFINIFDYSFKLKSEL
ncbi:MAG: hypothetical protein Q4E28_01680 [Clostridia bacterium]|nr:hypothetical protein [Clostridia bacterium]